MNIFLHRNSKGFYSIIGLLLSLAIICLLVYMMTNRYAKKPIKDQPQNDFISSQGINTSNYQGVLESTKKKIHAIEQERLDRSNDVLKQMQGR